MYRVILTQLTPSYKLLHLPLFTVSGEVPVDPVVSRKSGHLYERKLIEKYLQNEGKCPITGETMVEADLQTLQVNKTVKPRTSASASIPGLLGSLQNEWDDITLETFNLKQSLDATRRDLSQALYQHDAACRVIARLMRERDEARAQLSELQITGFAAPSNGKSGSNSGRSSSGSSSGSRGVGSSGGDDMDVTHDTSGPQTMEGLSALIMAKAQALSSGRRGRKSPETQAPKSTLEKFKAAVVATPHKATPAGVTCVAVQIHQDGDRILTGGVDKTAALMTKGGELVSRLSGHRKKITSVAFYPDQSASSPLFTASADCSVKVWVQQEGGQFDAVQTFEGTHSEEVSSISVHPVGSCLVSFSLDGSWALFDTSKGGALRQVGNIGSSKEFEYLCGQIHPDGMLLGGGTSAGVLKIWDLREQNNVANLEGHGGNVESLCFSENGYYLAAGDTQGTVRLWDLRKMKTIQTLECELTIASNCLHLHANLTYLSSLGSQHFSCFRTHQRCLF